MTDNGNNNSKPDTHLMTVILYLLGVLGGIGLACLAYAVVRMIAMAAGVQ